MKAKFRVGEVVWIDTDKIWQLTCTTAEKRIGTVYHIDKTDIFAVWVEFENRGYETFTLDGRYNIGDRPVLKKVRKKEKK